MCHLVDIFIQIYYIFYSINLTNHNGTAEYMVQATPESLRMVIQVAKLLSEAVDDIRIIHKLLE